MSVPLKSGADLYNQEARRMRLHALGADPTEVVPGLIYYNTGLSNHGNHACIYSGNSFKALAYMEDIAADPEFVALKNKVELLIGDTVDTDTIINSWKEVEAFLAGISETQTLQGMLESKADKSSTVAIENYVNLSDIANKSTNIFGYGNPDGRGWKLYSAGLVAKTTDRGFALQGQSNEIWFRGITDSKWDQDWRRLAFADEVLPLTGGTLVGKLSTSGRISTTSIIEIRKENGDNDVMLWSGTNAGIGERELALYTGSSWKKILHSGNYADTLDKTYLRLSGGMLQSATGDMSPLHINGNGTYSAIAFTLNASDNKAYLAYSGENLLFANKEGAWNTLLHKGNYADTLDKAYLKLSGGTIEGSLCIGKADNAAFNSLQLTRSGYGVRINNITSAAYITFGSVNQSNDLSAIASLMVSTTNLRASFDGNTTWKTVAFTDSTVAAAYKVVTEAGDNVVHTTSGAIYIGGGTYSKIALNLMGTNVVLRYGADGTNGLILNSSGNVTIGAEDKTSNAYKLCVDGDLGATGDIYLAGASQGWYDNSPCLYFARAQKMTGGTPKLAIRGISAGSGYGRMRLAILQDNSADYTSAPKEVVSVLPNGNVLIGNVTDKGEKLQVAGSISVTADIIGASNSTYDKWSISHASNTLYVQSGYSDGSNIYGKMMLSGINVNNLSVLTIRANDTTINGNLLIGATEDNGSGAKLQVNGDTSFVGSKATFGSATAGMPILLESKSNSYIWDYSANGALHIGSSKKGGVGASNASLSIGASSIISGNRNNEVSLGSDSVRWSNVYSVFGNFSSDVTINGKMFANAGAEINGDVEITGNLKVTGKISAKKEVSAGGKGRPAAEGEGGSTGSGNATGLFDVKPISIGTTSVTLNHGLETEDITVSIYEKNEGGKWSMILTDIEIVDINNIKVTFGSATTVEHKVVIMGAAV